jgi:hypothetical protein
MNRRKNPWYKETIELNKTAQKAQKQSPQKAEVGMISLSYFLALASHQSSLFLYVANECFRSAVPMTKKNSCILFFPNI